jgi:hypothetical protein
VLRTASLVGDYDIRISLTDDPAPTVRATGKLTTRKASKLDTSARQVMATDLNHEPLEEGLLFTTQTGSNAGHAFVGANGAALFYFFRISPRSAPTRPSPAPL